MQENAGNTGHGVHAASALYASALVKIPRPEFYVVYTGAGPCRPVMRLADAFLEHPSVNPNADSWMDLSVPVLTADNAEGVLAEYFGMISFIKAESRRLGSLQAAVKHAVSRYRRGYEISDFVSNQRGVYDALFEQMSREELMARQIEAEVNVRTQQVAEQVTQQVTEQVTQQVTEQVTQQVTEQVTQQVTEQVTQQVTEQVTQQVTEQVTQQVKNNDIVISYKMLLEAGIQREDALQSIIRNYSLTREQLQGILK